MSLLPPGNAVLDYEQVHFLDNLKYWSLITAYGLAAAEGIRLTTEHIDVLYKIRTDYDRLGDVDIEMLFKKLEQELGIDNGYDYLYKLFQSNPICKCFRIAGLPDKIFYPMH